MSLFPLGKITFRRPKPGQGFMMAQRPFTQLAVNVPDLFSAPNIILHN